MGNFWRTHEAAQKQRARRNEKRLDAAAWGGWTSRAAKPSGPGALLPSQEPGPQSLRHPAHQPRLISRTHRAAQAKRRQVAEQRVIAAEERNLRVRLSKRAAREKRGSQAHVGCCPMPFALRLMDELLGGRRGERKWAKRIRRQQKSAGVQA